jgi:hypothetical protein
MVQSTRLFATRLLVLGLTGAGIACQGGDLTLPSDGSSFSLQIVSGNGQQGTVGTKLDSALVVQVTNRGEPATDVSLRFEPKSPGLEVESQLVSTDENGLAETRVRLGATEGIQTVEAGLVQLEPALKASFTLTAVASEPHEDDDDGGPGRGRGNGGGNGGGDDDDEDDDD